MLKDRIQSMENELLRLLEGGGISGRSAVLKTVAKVHRKRRNLTAAGRAKISAAAKSRWAKIKAGKK